jgi:hypothetical protein
VEDEEAEAAEDAEAAVDEAPIEGDAADGPGDQGEEGDAGAGDETPGEKPFVADGIYVWPMKAAAMTRCAKASQSVP